MLVLLAVLVTMATLLLHMVKSRKFSYWSSRGFPTLQHKVSLRDVLAGKKYLVDADPEYYDEIGDEKFGGFSELGLFGGQTIFIKDLDLVKNILVKDFDHFSDRTGFGELDRRMGHSLTEMGGQEWKDMRTFLSPTFTSGKIKRMFCHFERTATKFNEHVKTHSNSKSDTSFDLPLLTSMYKYTLGNIATSVFGLDVDTFDKNNVFFTTTTEMFESIIQNRKMQFALAQNFPRFSKFFKIQAIEQKYSDFFWGLLNTALKARQEGSVKGNDFFQLLVDAQNEDNSNVDIAEGSKGNKKNIKWTDELACAQAFLFLGAGFSTVANNLAAALYLLASESEMQDKMYEEVNRIMGTDEKGGDKISYDDLTKLEYMEMFMSEILRLYPVQTRLDRIAVRDYEVLDSKNKKLVIPKGANVVISAEAIHKDGRYFANPLKFDPERFSQENKGKIHPYSYMPFSIGPRNCIGMRFALAETKVLLAHVVRNFVISPTESTPLPVKIGRNPVGYQIDNSVHLRFTPRA
ncbi:cytochrome P450 6a2 [Folsomia candida]|nr:cytochrome P450 6a2 [Folsomia candida]